MAVWHGERGKKATGGKIETARKKRKFELGSFPLHTTLGKEERKVERTMGGAKKVKAVSVEFANVTDTKTHATRKVKILDIMSNPANPHFVRRGIITKGAIVKTEAGTARITSRPSQSGTVSAVLVEEK